VRGETENEREAICHNLGKGLGHVKLAAVA